MKRTEQIRRCRRCPERKRFSRSECCIVKANSSGEKGLQFMLMIDRPPGLKWSLNLPSFFPCFSRSLSLEIYIRDYGTVGKLHSVRALIASPRIAVLGEFYRELGGSSLTRWYMHSDDLDWPASGRMRGRSDRMRNKKRERISVHPHGIQLAKSRVAAK